MADAVIMAFAVKDQVLSTASISTVEEAETETTQTPRSAVKSCDDSSVQTPRSALKSESSETTPLDEEGYQDAYYAFLRELAGSFEAPCEDDDSEWDSESEAGDEEGGDHPKKDRWSAEPRSDQKEEVAPMTRTLACGPPSSNDGGHPTSAKEVGSKGKDKGDHSAGLAGKLVRGNIVPRKEEAALHGLDNSPGPVTVSSDSDLSDGERDDDQEDARFCVPTPNHDNRPPVEDDYDVVQAVKDFASSRPGGAAQQRQQDLSEALKLKLAQAHALDGIVGNEHVNSDLRSHYAKVRGELLSEAEMIEQELASFGSEETKQQEFTRSRAASCM